MTCERRRIGLTRHIVLGVTDTTIGKRKDGNKNKDKTGLERLLDFVDELRKRSGSRQKSTISTRKLAKRNETHSIIPEDGVDIERTFTCNNTARLGGIPESLSLLTVTHGIFDHSESFKHDGSLRRSC